LNKKKLGFTLIPLTKLGKPFFEKMIFFPSYRPFLLPPE
jgi:hypothetical protein